MTVTGPTRKPTAVDLVNGMLSNCPLMFMLLHSLELLSNSAREVSLCRGQLLTQRLITGPRAENKQPVSSRLRECLKRGQKSTEEPEDGEEGCERLSLGFGMTTGLVSSLQLWSPAQDQSSKIGHYSKGSTNWT